MYIQSTAKMRTVLARQSDMVKELQRARHVHVPTNVGEETPSEEIEKAAMSVVREGNVEGLAVDLRYDRTDPEDLRSTADYLENLSNSLNRRAAALEPDKPKPEISYVRTATGATIGAVGGYSAALLLQELGKAGRASGNPFLSTLALACTIGGTAIGAGIGSRLVAAEMSGFGVTLTSVGEDDASDEQKG